MDRIMNDIYSPENIERSRLRAREIRLRVDEGRLPDPAEWLRVADEVDAYADEREREAQRRLEL